MLYIFPGAGAWRGGGHWPGKGHCHLVMLRSYLDRGRYMWAVDTLTQGFKGLFYVGTNPGKNQRACTKTGKQGEVNLVQGRSM